MRLRAVLGVAGLTLVACACAAAPSGPAGQKDAQKACDEWAQYRSNYEISVVGPYQFSIPSDVSREHLANGIDFAVNAESANGRYTALATDMEFQQTDSSEGTAARIDTDCASI